MQNCTAVPAESQSEGQRSETAVPAVSEGQRTESQSTNRRMTQEQIKSTHTTHENRGCRNCRQDRRRSGSPNDRSSRRSATTRPAKHEKNLMTDPLDPPMGSMNNNPYRTSPDTTPKRCHAYHTSQSRSHHNCQQHWYALNTVPCSLSHMAGSHHSSPCLPSTYSRMKMVLLTPHGKHTPTLPLSVSETYGPAFDRSAIGNMRRPLPTRYGTWVVHPTFHPWRTYFLPNGSPTSAPGCNHRHL